MANFDALLCSLEAMTLREMPHRTARLGDEVERRVKAGDANKADVEKIDRLLYFLWHRQAPLQARPEEAAAFRALQAKLQARGDWPRG